jgi:hypothetical protein
VLREALLEGALHHDIAAQVSISEDTRESCYFPIIGVFGDGFGLEGVEGYCWTVFHVRLPRRALAGLGRRRDVEDVGRFCVSGPLCEQSFCLLPVHALGQALLDEVLRVALLVKGDDLACRDNDAVGTVRLIEKPSRVLRLTEADDEAGGDRHAIRR